MEREGKGSHNDFSCELCKLKFLSQADHVLHEFSKKHCDNLIKLSKNKLISHRPKKKNKEPVSEKHESKVNTIIKAGSFAKYGYFVPGEIYTISNEKRKYNTEYDPYLQKFAENPFKEKNVMFLNENQPLNGFQTDVVINKKKKKKFKTCQVCSLTLRTVPEYDTHMKSPQHIWKLKMSGMGVSAHFVKASSDLQTTDIKEDLKSGNVKELCETSSTETCLPTVPFPLLYCSDCELLLNSPQQYNTHLAGKSHIECAQRKAEAKAKREKILNPTPNQLYCYSCNITLNNLFQYNEHKNGKKHMSKCRQLIKKGITIPPEERVHGLKSPKLHGNKPLIYPELYERFVLEKQEPKKFSAVSICNSEDCLENETKVCDICNLKFLTPSEYNSHCQLSHNLQLSNNCTNKNICPDSEKLKNSLEIKSEHNLELKQSTSSDIKNTLSLNVPSENWLDFRSTENQKEKTIKDIILVDRNEFLHCRICEQRFSWQTEFNVHSNSEDHFRKILELKTKGQKEVEILNNVIFDNTHVKRNGLNKLSCSFCNITTNSDDEFHQHLKSVVHKYAFKDFKRKKTTEVYSIAPVNEINMYFCKLCQDSWSTLLDFIQHLNFMKHRRLQGAEKFKKVLAKKRSILFKNRARICNLKINKGKSKNEKNLGDLSTDVREDVSNLKPLQPEIDPTKNVDFGSQENTPVKCRKIDAGTKFFRPKALMSPTPGTTQGFGHPHCPGGFRRPKPFRHHFPLLTNWSPYPRPYFPRPRMPYLMQNYSEPNWFQRPRYPRFLN